jgi:nicotinate-nucleotide adenylyltransferase
MASAADRLSMCRIAQAACANVTVEDIELRRTGPSYTIDTVLALRERGETSVAWLIGADMLQLLPKWHRAEELLETAQFVVMRRPGFAIDWRSLPPTFRHLEAAVVDAPLVDISATAIRRRLAAGESVAGMLPRGVEEYIHARGLYGAHR